MCAYAELCGVCICAKEGEKKLLHALKCAYLHTTMCMHMHVWGVHVYICSAETSLAINYGELFKKSFLGGGD